jgi:hypothetical protein
MTDPATSTRSWLRFSLRELLIGIVAVGAITALVAKSISDSFSTTSFYDSFDGRVLLEAAAKRSGMKLNVHDWHGTGERYDDFAIAECAATFTVPGTQQRGHFLVTLEAELMDRLEQDGHRVSGRGSSTSNMRDFVLRYTGDSACGTIVVYSLAGSDDEWKVAIVVHEFPRSSR